jgi:hypothetical protein
MPPSEKRTRDHDATGRQVGSAAQLTLDGYFAEERQGKRLMTEVYKRLQSCSSPLGLSASGILSMLPSSSVRAGRDRSEENVATCILALESAGLCYKTYDESHFLATSNVFTLTDEQMEPLLSTAFPSPQEDGASTIHPSTTRSAPSHNSTQLTRRAAGSTTCWPQAFREQQCTGRAPLWFSESAWLHSLNYSRKAKIMQHQASAGRMNRGVSSLEYSKTGEYVMAGSSHGMVTVIRCTEGDARLKNTWSEGGLVNPPAPIRCVKVSVFAFPNKYLC